MSDWLPTLPADAARWFATISAPWWIAGGCALNLFVGHQTRAHGDLDIGVLRRDVLEIIRQLPSWELFEAKDGELVQLRLSALPRRDVNSLWCRPTNSSTWAFELLLDEAEDDRWLFRRQPRLSRPLSTIIRHDPDGIPYLAPEIQLLYKARSSRPRDQVDFDHVVPLLDTAAYSWLQQNLLELYPHHAWLALLQGSQPRK